MTLYLRNKEQIAITSLVENYTLEGYQLSFTTQETYTIDQLLSLLTSNNISDIKVRNDLELIYSSTRYSVVLSINNNYDGANQVINITIVEQNAQN